MILATLENTKLSHQDIYILYIDFKNAFNPIYHLHLLAIMEDIGYPRGDHSLLYFAYTCVWDLFIGGVIYLAKNIIS
jgi:hypothetical protein